MLKFATGSECMPAAVDMGSWNFSIEHQHQPVIVEPTPANGLTAPAMLAKSHTCGNQLCLPSYPDVEALQRGLEYSLQDGGFGMV